MERTKAVFNWSGGKDSAHALLRAQQSGEYEIVALLTTVGTGTYSLTLNSRVVSEDNFACLTITGQQLKVDFHNKKGRIIESATIALK